jgi:allantoate deiminase
MTDIDVEALGRRAEAMVRELAAISAEPDRLVRLYLSPEHRRGADLVARWMSEAGLEVSEDALGTVRGRKGAAQEGMPGRNFTRRLLIGSHIDTVIDAGAYDGTFGVIAGILAAAHFRSRDLPFGLDVLAFGDEEGSRFPSTLASSAAVAGHLAPGTLDLTDRDGVSFAQALEAYGKDPGDIGSAAYPPDEAAAYVEVHIEQGPVLEHEGEALGIVTAIVGQTRLKVTVTGEAGHAGTVPMHLRRDALAGAAEMMLAVEALAIESDHVADRMVATVGIVDARPGASNVIPARVEFTIDLRCETDAVRHTAIARLTHRIEIIAERRRLVATVVRHHDIATTPCDPTLQAGLASAVEAGGGRAIRLPSGAGHDGQAMVKLCPVAMLFVRCRGGISHNPAEHASIEDMGRAIAALIRFVEGAARSA